MSEQNYRRILVAVSGMSPQIITETLYGLCGAPERRDNPWIPHEIHLITTEDGREQARLQLLEGKCHFRQFLLDYGIANPPHFALDTIHVIPAADGAPLADLRTQAENEAAADFITDKIRAFTRDDGAELHVSLAGGRKTMGFYVGYALSLFGRPQDRLSHVLVNSEYESLKSFFYPTPDTRVVWKIGRAGEKEKSLDASRAEVCLAEIPFVRLRGFLPKNALIDRYKFSEVVNLVRIATEPLNLKIVIADKKIYIHDRECNMSPTHFAFYVWFAKRREQDMPPAACPVEGEFNTEYRDEYLAILRRIKGESVSLDKTESETLNKGMHKTFFEQTASKVRKSLKDRFGPELEKRIGIQKVNSSRGDGYALALEKHQFFIE